MTDNTKTNRRDFARSDHAVVVMEAAGFWAAALRRLLSDTPVRIVETRSRAECLETVARLPSCLVVVQISQPDIDRGLKLLVDLDDRFGRVPAIAVASSECRPCRWLARQLGAVHFVTNARALRHVAPLVRRHFAGQPPPVRNATERILAELPWDE